MDQIIDTMSFMLMSKEELESYVINDNLEHCKYFDPLKLDYLVIDKEKSTDTTFVCDKTISYLTCIQNQDLEGLMDWYENNRTDIPYIDRLSYYLARNDLGQKVKKYEINEIKKISKEHRQIKKLEDDQIKRVERERKKKESGTIHVQNKHVQVNFI